MFSEEFISAKVLTYAIQCGILVVIKY